MEFPDTLPDLFNGVCHFAAFPDFTKSDVERTTGASMNVVLV